MNKKRIILIAAGFLLLFPVFLPAQTAAELETMLALPVITCAQAARFVAASSQDLTQAKPGESLLNTSPLARSLRILWK